NLWLMDTPLMYPASRGRSVRFRLIYKNRLGEKGNGDAAEPGIFSLGARWTSPWRSYLEAITSESTNFWFYAGYVSVVKMTINSLYYTTSAKLTQVSSTNIVQYADGSSDIFGQSSTISGVTRYFLTCKVDINGNTTVLQYTTSAGLIRLD